MAYRKRVAAEDSIAAGPACQHLRSKGMYVTGQLDPGEIGHSDGYCWCSQTQNVTGPDDQAVQRAGCNATRTCYVAVL